MLATHFTLSLDQVPTVDDLSMKSCEYLLIKPRAQNLYSNYGNYSGTNTGRSSSWYRPRDDMDKRRSRVVDIRKNLTVRNFFFQVAVDHPRACLNGMSLNPAVSDQAIPSGSRHLIVGDLCEWSDHCRVFRSLCGPGNQDDGVSEWGPGGCLDSDVGHQRYLEGSCYPTEQVGTSGGLFIE